jgi:hypothetical protein
MTKNDTRQDSNQYHIDAEEARRTRRAVSEIVTDRRADEIMVEAFPELAQSLQRQRDKIAREQTALEHDEAKKRAKVQQWESLLTTRDRLAWRINQGKGELVTLQESLAKSIEYADAALGDASGAPFPMGFFDGITSLESAIKFYPGWIERREAELVKVSEQIAAFATENGIKE